MAAMLPDMTSALFKSSLPLAWRGSKAFDPDQPRDESGRWTSTGAAAQPAPAARAGMGPDYRNPKTLASVRRTSEAAASDIYQIATSIEPVVTSDLKEVVGQNMRLAGLSHRIKSEESLRRKIFEESVDEQIDVREKAATIKDALRYTAVSAERDYASNVTRGIAALKAKGYSLVRATNYWGSGAEYQGINTSFKTPGGQVFELQFHTQRSFYVKEKLNHSLYEKRRRLGATTKEKEVATRKMIANQATVRMPPGVSELAFA